MLWSQTHIPTRREPPTGATAASHQLLVRAGLLRAQSPAMIEFLPLGLRVLGKLEEIAREALAALDATEIQVPRSASEMDLAEFVAAAVPSFDVSPNPRFLFRNKVHENSTASFFRPLKSPRCEVYAVRRHEQGPGSDRELRSAFEQVFARLGIRVIAADADSQAFVVLSDAGDDLLLRSDRGDYAATPDRARRAHALGHSAKTRPASWKRSTPPD